MRKEQSLRELEVECPSPEALGYVIGQLTRIGSWLTNQKSFGDRFVIVADVPEDAIPGFVEWLESFEPVRGSAVLGAAANDEDA